MSNEIYHRNPLLKTNNRRGISNLVYYLEVVIKAK